MEQREEGWAVSFKNKDGSWNHADVLALVILVVSALSLVAAILMMMSQEAAR